MLYLAVPAQPTFHWYTPPLQLAQQQLKVQAGTAVDGTLTTVTPLYPLFALCSVWTLFQPAISMILTICFDHLCPVECWTDLCCEELGVGWLISHGHCQRAEHSVQHVENILASHCNSQKTGAQVSKKQQQWELFLASTYHINYLILHKTVNFTEKKYIPLPNHHHGMRQKH